MANDLNIPIYLNSKDAVALRYLTEYDHLISRHGALRDAKMAENYAVFGVIHKFWEVLGNLELFAKHGSVVVIRDADGTDTTFDWKTIFDGTDYEPEPEPNTEIRMNQPDFILFEACLRRVLWFVTEGRIPSQQEMFRIALRFRATTVRYWNSKQDTKKEFGIATPRGLAPLF